MKRSSEKSCRFSIANRSCLPSWPPCNCSIAAAAVSLVQTNPSSSARRESSQASTTASSSGVYSQSNQILILSHCACDLGNVNWAMSLNTSRSRNRSATRRRRWSSLMSPYFFVRTAGVSTPAMVPSISMIGGRITNATITATPSKARNTFWWRRNFLKGLAMSKPSWSCVLAQKIGIKGKRFWPAQIG